MDIKKHIKASGKSVKSVCAEAGISRAAFYIAIQPEANVQLNTLLAIARATGLTVAQIKPEVLG
jgi:DNA-binding phage protein